VAEPLYRPHARVHTDSLSHPGGGGTLCALLRSRDDPEQLFALCAGHVWAGEPAARFGDALTLRSGDVAVTGRLFNWSPDLTLINPSVALDAGLATLKPSALAALSGVMDWPLAVAEAVPGARLRLLVRHHRVCATLLPVLNASIALNSKLTYTVQDALHYELAEESQPGDSGAPLWDEHEALVGLHLGEAPPPAGAAAGRHYGFGVPMRRVLDWAQADAVLRAEILSQPVGAAEHTLSDVDVLARTLWGEARGEPDAARSMLAVAQVVLNRAADTRRWRGVAQVCLAPRQFSCWNREDPNRAPLLAVRAGDAQFDLALRIARQVLQQPAPPDITGGATHYHALHITQPAWARLAQPTVRIGAHQFYRNVP
jgi:Cell Wall Hydrolase